LKESRLEQSLLRAEKAVLLLAVAGVPLFFLYGYTLDAINLPKIAALLVLVPLALGLRLANYGWSGKPFGGRALLWPAALLTVPLVLSWLVSDQKGFGLFGQYLRYQGLIPYLLVTALGLLLLDAFKKDAAPIAAAVGVAASGVAAYGLLQRFGADPLIWASTDMGSTLGNSNFTAQFLAISLPILLGLWHSTPRSRLLLKYALPAIAIAWLLTRGEGGLIAGLVGIATFYAFLVTQKRMKILLFGGSALLVAFGVAAIIGSVTLPIGDGKLISLKDRGWHWQSSVSLFAEAPVFGHGPNGFALQAFQNRSKEEALTIPMSLYVDDVYSVPLSYGVSAGALGLSGFLLFIRWVVRRSSEVAKRRAPMVAGWTAAVVAYLVQSLFSFDEPSSRVLLWVSLAGLVGGLLPHDAEDAPKTSHRWMRRVASALAVVLVPLGVWQSSRLIGADHAAREGRVASEAFDFAAAADHYEAAVHLHGHYFYRLQEATALGRAGLSLGAAGEPLLESMRMRFATISDGPIVTRRFQEAGLAAGFAIHDDAWGDLSAELYEEALGYDPWNVELSIGRARVLTTVGRYREALETLEPFVAEELPRAAFWCARARAQRRGGQIDAAQISLSTAFRLDPGGAAALYRREGLQVGPLEPPCS
jgi:O-antigen ligase